MDVYCHQKGKDWSPPLLLLRCMVTAESWREKHEHVKTSAHTQTHTNTGNVLLLSEPRRRSMRRRAERVIDGSSVHACVCVLVTEI